MSSGTVTCLDDLQPGLSLIPGTARCNSDITMALFHITNLTIAMQNLADRMSDHIRRVSTDTTIGHAFTNEAYIEVRWAWLNFPIGVVLLAFGLLVTAIIMSRDKASTVWKSDSLATLLHGLHSTDPRMDLRHQRQMDKAAEEIRVRLQYTADGELKLLSEDSTSREVPVAEPEGRTKAVHQATCPLTAEKYSHSDLLE
ncbi:hypothetical protein MMC30_007856 [Trapelia coarctata]|nr:hypothetical protein [Trapelia coarctata]